MSQLQFQKTPIYLEQGRPTRGPRKGYEWPAQYFLKLSVPSILAEVEDRFDMKTSFFMFFSNFRDCYDFGTKSGKSATNFRRGLVFLEITMILLEKVGNLILILGEDLFFRDHYDFGAKSGKSETDFR